MVGAVSSARSEGRIRSWKDDKGFGFIEPDGGGDDLFVHASAFDVEGRRPAVGDRVSFDTGRDRKGRPCALRVVMAGAAMKTRRVEARGESPAQWGGATLFLIPLFLLLMVAVSLLWRAPYGWFLLYLTVSLVTVALYAIDKQQAAMGAMRVPEARLHLLSLVGGWPGALVAQQFLRHKTVKPSFRRLFWITVVLNVAAYLFLTSPLGGPLVARWLG